MIFVKERKIYGYECDIYGHLNNSNYLQFYESARSDALTDMNFPIKQFNDQGIHLYITRIELDYKAGVFLEDVVTIKSWMSTANRLGSTWIQKLYNSQRQLCNQAIVKVVHAKNGKPFRIDHETALFFKSFVEEKEI
ncbi:MAG: thioesterase family protein [Candidatus Cloacimonadales bacterium]|nr:thioesterase family protein [Candidatus Cloacimonadales bacterium]